jgi:hypothetical protein
MMKSLLKLLGEPLAMNLVINFQSFGFAAACGHWRVLVVMASGRSFGTTLQISEHPQCATLREKTIFNDKFGDNCWLSGLRVGVQISEHPQCEKAP